MFLLRSDLSEDGEDLLSGSGDAESPSMLPSSDFLLLRSMGQFCGSAFESSFSSTDPVDAVSAFVAAACAAAAAACAAAATAANLSINSLCSAEMRSISGATGAVGVIIGLMRGFCLNAAICCQRCDCAKSGLRSACLCSGTPGKALAGIPMVSGEGKPLYRDIMGGTIGLGVKVSVFVDSDAVLMGRLGKRLLNGLDKADI
jgi:hypothetical protein